MTPGVPPDYHPAVIQDRTTGDAFLTRSTVPSIRTIERSDRNTYPLTTVDITAARTRSGPTGNACSTPPASSRNPATATEADTDGRPQTPHLTQQHPQPPGPLESHPTRPRASDHRRAAPPHPPPPRPRLPARHPHTGLNAPIPPRKPKPCGRRQRGLSTQTPRIGVQTKNGTRFHLLQYVGA